MAGAALEHEAKVRHASFHVEVKVGVVTEERQQQVLASLAVLVPLVLISVARVALERKKVGRVSKLNFPFPHGNCIFTNTFKLVSLVSSPVYHCRHSWACAPDTVGWFAC